MSFSFCGDCGVGEGELHEEGCDHETCPVCGWQRLMCEHRGKNCDLTGVKREPHIQNPVIAYARCGKLYPEFFMVRDEEWKEVCGLTYPTKSVLCKPCFDDVKRIRNMKGGGKHGKMLEM